MSARHTSRRSRRKPTVHNTFLAVALVVLWLLSVAIGYSVITYAGRRADAPVSEAVTTVTVTQSPAANTVAGPVTETPEPSRCRDDIVSDGNLLSYELQEVMQDCGEEYGVPYALLLAMADVESRFDPDAASSTNDYGLMQINQCNHAWLREMGLDPLDPAGNIEAGAYIISQHLQSYGEPELALMAYNCGPSGAKKLWDAGTYQTDYSRKVMAAFEHWASVLEE